MDSDLSSNGPDSSGGDITVGSRTRVVLAPKWLGKRVGRFKLLALLGQGAMGRVFRAEDTMMQRHVALKLLPRTVKRGSNSIGAEMLIREARAAASIEHVGAVQIYEINEAGDVYYIAMELLEGGSLRDLVKAAGPLDVTRSCLLAAEAAETLAFAHSVGVVHRDVKPANLMLNRSGRCKVVDFGLARVDDPSDLTSFLAESVGTPQFIAPEILTGTPASAQSDIYSLGGTVWYLLTGHPPFEAGTSQELLQKHLSCPLPDLKLVRPDVPKGLAEALAKALAKRPGERYSSMDQFAKVLRVHTIPLAASAADIETLTAAAGPPALPPPPTPEGVEDPPLPVYQVPPSPRMSASVSRPASPLDPRSSSSISRPAAPVNRSMRPATPFDQVPSEEAAIEEPPADDAMEEQAAEEATAAEVEYATPAPSPGPNWVTWAVVGGLSVAVTIGIIMGCIFLLRPGVSEVSTVSPPPQPSVPTPAPTASHATHVSTAKPHAAVQLEPVAQWVADDYRNGSNWVDRKHGIVAEPKNSPSSASNAFNGHAAIHLNGKNQYFIVRAADDLLGDGKAMTLVAVIKPTGSGRKGKEFWNSSGVVGADVKGTVNDWGLGWGGASSNQAVAGAGNFPPGHDGAIQSPNIDAHHTHVLIMTWQFSGSQSGGTATLRLYVDGSEVAQDTKPSEPRIKNNPFAIGAMSIGGQMPFSGKFAEVRIYNDALKDPSVLSKQLLETYFGSSHDENRNPNDPNGLLGR
jgi:serine/threonine protein kinase